MRKKLSIIFISLFVCFLFFNLVPSRATGIVIENPLAAKSFEELAGNISWFLFRVGMVLAPLMLVVAGLMYVTSAGSPTRVQTAQRIALYTVIGLAIILLASGLIAVLKSIIGYQG